MNSVDPLQGRPYAIRAAGLSKRYRLYTKPLYRALDLFDLCPAGPQFYTEHKALHEVDLTIAPGEKVAVVGRNGAGKSTLLKAIVGLVRPTEGEVEVHGRVSNLLQIGSGFHPDFTGRQNVFASLAHQGIIGRAAAAAFEEILAFAEIEEYIDQPMKTYSTGMCSRLMFASSIIVKPDVLVVDEILGVGDAYFSHKSFERMRELCTRDGTTLLLVTHDVYSALNLCDRFIWLDRGRVQFDGDGKSAVALYENSIKQQEEHALRQQNLARLAASREATVLHVLLRTQTGFAPTRPAAFEAIELTFSDGRTSALVVADGAADWTLSPEGNLGGVEEAQGRRVRQLRTAGSIFHKAEWLVTIPAGAELAAARVRWYYRGQDPIDLRVFTKDRTVLVAGTLEPAARWQEATFPRGGAATAELDSVKQMDYGTGLVRIAGVQFIDEAGREVVEARHLSSLTVRIRVHINPALADRVVTFVLAFARHGTPYNAYVYQPVLSLPPEDDEAQIEVGIDSLPLGSGQWYVNIGIGERGLFDQDYVRYFTLNPSWHHLLASRIEFRVSSISVCDASGCFTVLPAAVRVQPAHASLVGPPAQLLSKE